MKFKTLLKVWLCFNFLMLKKKIFKKNSTIRFNSNRIDLLWFKFYFKSQPNRILIYLTVQMNMNLKIESNCTTNTPGSCPIQRPYVRSIVRRKQLFSATHIQRDGIRCIYVSYLKNILIPKFSQVVIFSQISLQLPTLDPIPSVCISFTQINLHVIHPTKPSCG